MDDRTHDPRTSQPTHADPLALVIWSKEGPRVERLSGEPLVIGRGAPAQLVVADATLSREHARVQPFDGGVHIEDLASKNGLFVRGRRVASAELFPGDVCELGDVRISLTSLSRAAPVDAQPDLALDRLDLELAAARVFGRPLAIALVDATEPRAAIERSIRTVDLVGGYTATQLLVVIAQGDGATAQRLIEGALGGARAGIATCPEIEPDAHLLLAAARAALASASPGGIVIATPATPPPTEMLVASPRMRDVVAEIHRCAPSALPVLVLGETGAGKELVAREVHARSGRTGPFRVINCGAIPPTLTESVLFGHVRGAFTGATADRKGLFEEAEDGTVFLDEIGELPLAAQVALLRVLDRGHITRVGSVDERPVNARVVAATHRDLTAMIAAGSFRSDLYYRLDALTVTVPPLRERPEDLLALADRFLRAARTAAGKSILSLDGAVAQALLDHRWPGNVRELRNTMERAALVAAGPSLSVADLPDPLRSLSPLERERDDADDLPVLPELDEETGTGALRDRLREVEVRLILRALDRTNGNQGAAAKLLGLPKRTLVYKIARFGLKRIGRYELSD